MLVDSPFEQVPSVCTLFCLFVVVVVCGCVFYFVCVCVGYIYFRSLSSFLLFFLAIQVDVDMD